MSERCYLTILGLPAVGKSSVAKHVASTLGFSVASSGEVLRTLAAERGQALEKRSDYASFQRQVRHDLGETALIDMLLATPGDGLVIDSVRNIGDYIRFKQVGGQSIALFCDPRISYGFASKRRDIKDSIGTEEEFVAACRAEYHETLPNGQTDPYGLHTYTIMLNADHIIPADVSLGVVKKEVMAVIEQHVLKLPLDT
ncbi:MAG TPA: AAA family ATPase [Candidatus Saccharimonadales bacterium]|nr:AAA family ATPase [Candidatus Saccharimonadales bacterium]